MCHHQVVGVADQLQHLVIRHGAVERDDVPVRLLRWRLAGVIAQRGDHAAAEAEYGEVLAAELRGTLGEAAASAARTKTFLASRYKRIARRRGKQRALVAVGNSILVIAWHLLSDPAAHFTDLGPDWHDRLAPLRRKRQLIAELERLSGKKVTLHDTA